MNTASVNKDEFPEVFFENEEMEECDIQLFKELSWDGMSENEKIFFTKMKEKVEGEFAPSADLILLEGENKDEIYFIRYYFCEFKIGKRGGGEGYLQYFIC